MGATSVAAIEPLVSLASMIDAVSTGYRHGALRASGGDDQTPRARARTPASGRAGASAGGAAPPTRVSAGAANAAAACRRRRCWPRTRRRARGSRAARRELRGAESSWVPGGRCRSGTLAVYVVPLPWNWSCTWSPGCMPAIAVLDVGRVRDRSAVDPRDHVAGSMPAACAGLPGNTSTTITPPYGEFVDVDPEPCPRPAGDGRCWPLEPPLRARTSPRTPRRRSDQGERGDDRRDRGSGAGWAGGTRAGSSARRPAGASRSVGAAGRRGRRRLGLRGRLGARPRPAASSSRRAEDSSSPIARPQMPWSAHSLRAR